MRIGFAFCATGATHEEIVAFGTAARQATQKMFAGDLHIVVLILSDGPKVSERFADCVIHASPTLFEKPELTLLRLGSSMTGLDHLVISRFGGRFQPVHLHTLLPHHLASRAGASIPQYRYSNEDTVPDSMGDLAHAFECHLLSSRVHSQITDLQPDVFLFSKKTVDELLRETWYSSRTGFALECSAILLARTIPVTSPELALSPYEHQPHPYQQQEACERLRLLSRRFGGLGRDGTQREFELFCRGYRWHSKADNITRYTEEVLQRL